MRLRALTPEAIRRALATYLEEAYPGGPPARLRVPQVVREGATLALVLSGFLDESRRGQGTANHRFILRLGNERYPFMKLVLQEYLIEDEYVFAVDTHDEMDIKPNFPDYEEWERLRKFNSELRKRIEGRWREAGLDTTSRVRERAAELPSRQASGSLGKRALVADDEPDLAAAVGSILRREGFDVDTACDGEEALEKVRRLRPDLVVLDYEMPGLDGVEVIDRMKSDPEVRDIPVVLATASAIGFDEARKASGFLVKPFSGDVLVSLCRHLAGAPAIGLGPPDSQDSSETRRGADERAREAPPEGER